MIHRNSPLTDEFFYPNRLVLLLSMFRYFQLLLPIFFSFWSFFNFFFLPSISIVNVVCPAFPSFDDLIFHVPKINPLGTTLFYIIFQSQAILHRKSFFIHIVCLVLIVSIFRHFRYFLVLGRYSNHFFYNLYFSPSIVTLLSNAFSFFSFGVPIFSFGLTFNLWFI